MSRDNDWDEIERGMALHEMDTGTADHAEIDSFLEDGLITQEEYDEYESHIQDIYDED